MNNICACQLSSHTHTLFIVFEETIAHRESTGPRVRFVILINNQNPVAEKEAVSSIVGNKDPQSILLQLV